MVEIPIFDSTCNDFPVEIIYAEDSSKLSSIALEIKLDESYTDESVSVELALLPAALPVTAEAIHELTIQIPINLPNNNNDNQTNNSNNTNNTDNSNNNTNDNNSNKEDNQTDYDLDDDEVIDSGDKLPDDTNGTDESDGNNSDQLANNSDEDTDTDGEGVGGNSDNDSTTWQTCEYLGQQNMIHPAIYVLAAAIGLLAIALLIVMRRKGGGDVHNDG